MINRGDMNSYNNVIGAPATPFGLQSAPAPVSYNAQGLPVYPTPAAPATRAATGPGTLDQQLQAAWTTGDYNTVNNLVKQNNITTTQAQSLYGITPQQAGSRGIELVQAMPPRAMTPADFVYGTPATPATSTATT